MGNPTNLNELLSDLKVLRLEGPFSDFMVTYKGQSFEVYANEDGDIWVTLPNKDTLPTFWDWVGTPTQKLTVFVDYTTGELSPRTFNEANNSDGS